MNRLLRNSYVVEKGDGENSPAAAEAAANNSSDEEEEEEENSLLSLRQGDLSRKEGGVSPDCAHSRSDTKPIGYEII